MNPKKPNKISQMFQRKLLCQTPYVCLYETPEGFFYSERKGVDSVAILCFKLQPNREPLFLVHYQVMPQIVQKPSPLAMYPCPITGSFEPQDTPISCALREVEEEGGIKVEDPSRVVASYKALATTQMNEQVYHFVVDVTGLNQIKPLTDGSFFEQFADNKWLSQQELEHIIFESNDVQISSLAICYLLWQRRYK